MEDFVDLLQHSIGLKLNGVTKNRFFVLAGDETDFGATVLKDFFVDSDVGQRGVVEADVLNFGNCGEVRIFHSVGVVEGTDDGFKVVEVEDGIIGGRNNVLGTELFETVNDGDGAESDFKIDFGEFGVELEATLNFGDGVFSRSGENKEGGEFGIVVADVAKRGCLGSVHLERGFFELGEAVQQISTVVFNDK